MLNLKESFAVRGGFLNKNPATFDYTYFGKGFVDSAFSFCIVLNPHFRSTPLLTRLKFAKSADLSFTSIFKVIYFIVKLVNLHNLKNASQSAQQYHCINREVYSFIFKRVFKIENLYYHLDGIKRLVVVIGSLRFLYVSKTKPQGLTLQEPHNIKEIYHEGVEAFGCSLNQKDTYK